MKIVQIGSCISLQVTRFLIDRGHEKIASFSHLKSEFLRGYLDSNLSDGVYELEKIKELLPDIRRDKTRNTQEKIRMNEKWIVAQTSEILRTMESSIAVCDVLVVDSLYDVRSKLFKINNAPRAFPNLKLVGNLYDDFELKEQKLLAINEVHDNYKYVFSVFKDINPNLKVFFINPPVTGFELSSKSKNLDISVIINRTKQLSKLKFDGDVFVFPAFDLKEEFVDAQKGATYYFDPVTEAYATTIENVIQSEDFSEQLSENFALYKAKEVNIPIPQAIECNHPYSSLPPSAYWRKAIADNNPFQFKDIYKKKFTISKDTKVATFGSCFAQHIGKHLRRNGVNCLDVEPAPEDMPFNERKQWGYELYSARYGNIYSARQMRQLFDSAFEKIQFDDVWEKDNRYYDAFRPTLSPGGYETKTAVLTERKEHLKKVRELFQNLDLLVFTFGLTETWENVENGSVYPVCPGVTVGIFDENLHRFKNMNFEETLADFEYVLQNVKKINEKAKFLVTVSPVPLTATASGQHVLPATIHSKSILRAVCSALCDKYPDLDYFPSYEIISSFPYRGMFFEPNMRSVSMVGVEHVMAHFFDEHRNLSDANSYEDEYALDLICEEELLDN